ncbi:MAG: hypothetical protein JNN05_08535 [Candidatus Omnitrophica bacterium]|nr:hypothetical protein [Candidatus Omnitrophota bacterium]
MNQADHVSNDVRTCLTVFPILALLILITVFVHQAHLPYKVQLIIEIIKAFIAGGYFIHLIANRRDINATWIMTIVFVAALLFLPIANALNHINGSTDTSRPLQLEKLKEQPEGEHHNVH